MYDRKSENLKQQAKHDQHSLPGPSVSLSDICIEHPRKQLRNLTKGALKLSSNAFEPGGRAPKIAS